MNFPGSQKLTFNALQAFSGSQKHMHWTWRAFSGSQKLTYKARVVRILAVALLILAGELGAQTNDGHVFRFKLETDEVLAVDKYQDILILKGGQVATREEKNRIVLKVMDRRDDTAILEGLFYTYFRQPRKVGLFRQDKDFFSRFSIEDSGKYRVPDEYVMPNLRDLPTFPDTALRPGDEWTMPAQETMDFQLIKVKIPLKVFYRYTGQSPLLYPGEEKGRLFDRFEYTYSFHRPVVHPSSPVVQVHGFSSDQLWFDREQGIPVFDSNRLKYTFLMRDGSVVEYLYRIDSWWRKFKRTTDEEKIKIAKRLGKELEDSKSISVRPDATGVILDLNDILFETDSDKLSPRAAAELGKVAAILKKQFPNREIRISGHTDSTGSASYNKELSTRRARSVGNALQQQHDLDPRRMSFQGYGESRPVAPNETKEGRAKNRRVEILIVTE